MQSQSTLRDISIKIRSYFISKTFATASSALDATIGSHNQKILMYF
ncbi:hypothetical protein [Methanobacterium spitsbergense]|uniref:Uncharacterized protein n=1 Tax=Methanobacterium spitsbergense TaxID=2874285 RepID=A0A8T5UQG9_9EURY|nr:hypothetical protein [Methanobacterium spitsbergense]MBZ2165914.1 hypothetical protein [Methanobacterium spitsbergense]